MPDCGPDIRLYITQCCRPPLCVVEGCSSRFSVAGLKDDDLEENESFSLQKEKLSFFCSSGEIINNKELQEGQYHYQSETTPGVSGSACAFADGNLESTTTASTTSGSRSLWVMEVDVMKLISMCPFVVDWLCDRHRGILFVLDFIKMNLLELFNDSSRHGRKEMGIPQNDNSEETALSYANQVAAKEECLEVIPKGIKTCNNDVMYTGRNAYIINDNNDIDMLSDLRQMKMDNISLRPVHIPPFLQELRSIGYISDEECQPYLSVITADSATTSTKKQRVCSRFASPFDMVKSKFTSLTSDIKTTFFSDPQIKGNNSSFHYPHYPLIVFSGTITNMCTKSIVPFITHYHCFECNYFFLVRSDPFHRGKTLEKGKCPMRCGGSHSGVAQGSNPFSRGGALQREGKQHLFGKGGFRIRPEGSSPEPRVVSQTWMDYSECYVQQFTSDSSRAFHQDDNYAEGEGRGARNNNSQRGEMGVGHALSSSLPRSVIVTLDDELSSKINAGQRVVVMGLVGKRWKDASGVKPVELIVWALNIVVYDSPTRGLNSYEYDEYEEEEKGELVGESGMGVALPSYREPLVNVMYSTLNSIRMAYIQIGERKEILGCDKNSNHNGDSHSLSFFRPTGKEEPFYASSNKTQQNSETPAFFYSPVFQKCVLRSLLIQSSCTQLYGMLAPKMSILLSAVGDTSSRSMEDDGASINTNVTMPNDNGTAKRQRPTFVGHHVRGTIHCLFVGDPSTGKSQLLRFSSQISSKSVLTTGFTSTSAGLTAAATRDKNGSGETGLEPGALVLADNGTCIIDELNTISLVDRTALHEAMEQQTISIAKAGLVVRLKTECSIVAACNPPMNHKKGSELGVEIGIGGPLLSRFDLIFLLWDDMTPDHDEAVASHILGECVRDATGYMSKSPPISPDLLCWHMSYVRASKNSNIFGNGPNTPLLNDEAAELISHYYEAQRTRGASPLLADVLPVTVRFLESLIRLTRAHCRLMSCNQAHLMKMLGMKKSSSLVHDSGRQCCSPQKLTCSQGSNRRGMNCSYNYEGHSLSASCDVYDAAMAIFLMERSAYALKLKIEPVFPHNNRHNGGTAACHRKNLITSVLNTDWVIDYILKNTPGKLRKGSSDTTLSKYQLEDVNVDYIHPSFLAQGFKPSYGFPSGYDEQKRNTLTATQDQEENRVAFLPSEIQELYTSSRSLEACFYKSDLKSVAMQHLALDWIIDTVMGINIPRSSDARCSAELGLLSQQDGADGYSTATVIINIDDENINNGKNNCMDVEGVQLLSQFTNRQQNGRRSNLSFSQLSPNKNHNSNGSNNLNYLHGAATSAGSAVEWDAMMGTTKMRTSEEGRLSNLNNCTNEQIGFPTSNERRKHIRNDGFSLFSHLSSGSGTSPQQTSRLASLGLDPELCYRLNSSNLPSRNVTLYNTNNEISFATACIGTLSPLLAKKTNGIVTSKTFSKTTTLQANVREEVPESKIEMTSSAAAEGRSWSKRKSTEIDDMQLLTLPEDDDDVESENWGHKSKKTESTKANRHPHTASSNVSLTTGSVPKRTPEDVLKALKFNID